MRSSTFSLKSLAVLLLAGLLAIVVLPARADNKPAPDFVGLTMTGEHIRLSDFRGKQVVLEWTNHQCPYVRKHYGSGNMQKTQRALTEDGAVWISIISSAPGKQGYVTAEEAQQLTTARGSYADYVVLDPSGSIGQQYGAKTTPHMFVIDEVGQFVYQGAIDDIPSASRRTLKDATNLVLAAWADFQASEPVARPITKPYGCTVKYSHTID
jgi:peroxiredoxin